MEKDQNISSESFLISESHNIIYSIIDKAELKYKDFKKNDFEHSVILFAEDFRPCSNRNIASHSLEILLPSQYFITVNYSILFKNMIRIFDLDRYDNDFETGKGKSIPEIKTRGLDNFKKNYPELKMKTEYMSFELEPGEKDERRIIKTRFFDPVTNELISEVWEAIKYKTSL